MPQTKEFYDFGAFRLDARERLLWHNGKPVALALREFEVLLFLVENAGRVLNKDQLLDAVWKDVFIEEATLAQNISRLRRKLEAENKSGEKIIETLPKRGYRFLPAVRKTAAPAVVVEEQTQTRIRVEETLTLPDVLEVEKGRKGVGEIQESDTEDKIVVPPMKNKTSALPTISSTPFLPFSTSPFLWLPLGALAIAVVGFVVYQIYFAQAKPKITFIANVTPFSGAAGYENTPAFSPDGRYLAYAWNNGGERLKTDIYVQLLGAGEPVPLTDTEVGEHYPVFSPDGSHVAFIREFKTHGEVILIPALGGAERRVARLFSGNYSISFAPDGSHIAVIDTADSASDKQFAVHLVNLKTGERRRLTVAGEFTGETTPRFAPDGKQLAFVRVFPGYTHDLFVVSTEGSGNQPRQITFDNRIIHSLAWSADGREIFFVSMRESNRANIWRVAATGGEPELLATSGRGITNIATSPDGKRIAFVDNSINNDIWRLDAREGTPRKFIATTNSEDSPQLSPDGSRVLFLSNRSGRREAWLADAAGKNLRQLTDSGFPVNSVRFSPDGTRIVYAASVGIQQDIFTQPIEDSGAPQRLTTGREDDFAPDWSADGRWIYFTSDRTGASEIWRVPAHGAGEAVQITRSGAFVAHPAPDGATLFYAKQNSADLWRAAADGNGAEQPVPEFAVAGFTGQWTMTRAGIYFFAKAPDGARQTKLYDFAAGQIKTVAGGQRLPNNPYSSLDASADGTVFLYSLQDQNASNIMLAELGK